MVLGYPTFTSIPRVDGLSMGHPGFGASQRFSKRIYIKKQKAQDLAQDPLKDQVEKIRMYDTVFGLIKR